MISVKVRQELVKAMKSRDDVRLSTFRMLSSALKNEEIKKRPDQLTQEDEIRVVVSEAKKRKDAIELYEKSGNSEKAELERKELEILEEFLPKKASEEEIESLVVDAIEKTGASEVSDMGKVIGMVMGKLGASADGKVVSEVVKSKLL